MKATSSWTSMQGCLEAFKIILPCPFSRITGRTYGIGAAFDAWAKLTMASSWAMTSLKIWMGSLYPIEKKESSDNFFHYAENQREFVMLF